ncbi:MAG: hypothetical protein ACYCUD_08550 [Candidatus Dormibacteria bacterium]
MIAVAVLGGVAIGAGILVVVRRERPFQLLACLVVSLAVALALAVAGAVVPAVGMVVLGGVAGALVLMPLDQERRPDPQPDARPGSRASLAVEMGAALSVVALLLGAGFAARSSFHHPAGQAPSLTAVGHQIVLGVGVPVLGLMVLAATVLVGATALIGRDRREVAEDQAEAQRRRRAAEQERRARQRAAARAAARQARRGAGR